MSYLTPDHARMYFAFSVQSEKPSTWSALGAIQAASEFLFRERIVLEETYKHPPEKEVGEFHIHRSRKCKVHFLMRIDEARGLIYVRFEKLSLLVLLKCATRYCDNEVFHCTCDSIQNQLCLHIHPTHYVNRFVSLALIVFNKKITTNVFQSTGWEITTLRILTKPPIFPFGLDG